MWTTRAEQGWVSCGWTAQNFRRSWTIRCQPPLFKSRVLLLLGDVERGVEQMRQMPTDMLRWDMDHSLPPEVVADPRYHAVLEELGVGDSWRQYLIKKVKEMEPHTGIGFPARVSVSMADIYRSAGDE